MKTLLMLVYCMVSAQFTQGAQYQVTDLGPASGNNIAMNNNGWVTWYGGSSYGSLLYRNGERINVNSGAPHGISDSGTIVGQSYDGSGGGFVWKNNQTVNVFSGIATAVNNNGIVVGNGQSPYLLGWSISGGLCYQNGAVTSLFDTRTGREPGSSSSALAYAINNNGTIAGTIGSGTYNPYGVGPTVVLWFGASSSPTFLGTIAGSQVTGLSSDDRVVGTYTNQSWLWQNGSLQQLGEPSPNAGFYAESVNDKGQVLGVSYGLAGNGGKGALMLWENGVFTNINDLIENGDDYRFYNYAMAINDSGQISAISSINGGSTEALFITNIPEPTTLGMLSFCLLAPMRRKR